MKRFRKIEDVETIKPFNCGDKTLNGFLLDDVRFFYDEFIANTFILEDDTETIAYFSLLNDKVSNTTVPQKVFGGN